MRKRRTPLRKSGVAGFSLVELLFAILILSFIMVVAFSALAEFTGQQDAERNLVETRQNGQATVQLVADAIQHAGLGVDRRDPYNRASWQRSIVYAGSHILGFNADLDPDVGALDNTLTVMFPNGESYRGEAGIASKKGAESYVWTLDATGDGVVTLDDRLQAPAGSYNPANDTANPLDFALFRRTYGYNGITNAPPVTPISGSLFSNATSAVMYPDGSSPEPLFTYWLSEDLNRDNLLDPAECVVVPCPPSSSRPPRLYLWGDTDFNGLLSEQEKEALRTLHVGSAAWSRNRLAPGGVYGSTSLSTAVTGGQSNVLPVLTMSAFGPGEFIQLGSGTSSERLLIRSVDTACCPQTITLATRPTYSYAFGAPVKILPSTLLQAIRAVDVNYGAITPEKVISGATGGGPLGRSGRSGTRGLDYKVLPVHRRVELVNLQSTALVRNSGTFESSASGISVQSYCNGSIQSEVKLLMPLSSPAPISFLVRDSAGNPISGAVVAADLPQQGTLSSDWVDTDANGIATFEYTPSAPGEELLTVTVGIPGNQGQWIVDTTTINIKMNKMTVLTAADCQSTVSQRTPLPSTDFLMQVDSAAGVVKDVPIDLVLEFDSSYLANPELGFSILEAQLLIDGTSVGVTDPSSGSLTYSTTTGSDGVINGVIRLTKDMTGQGALLHLKSRGSATSCSSLTAEASRNIAYYRLNLRSLNPVGECTPLNPCVIPAGSPPPAIEATLTIGGQGVPGAAVAFGNIDSSATGATSVFSPPGPWVTDANGRATVSVVTANGAVVNQLSPLQTTVDVVSSGNPASCTVGNIKPSRYPLYFRLEGSVEGCEIDLPQNSISVPAQNNPYQLCLSLKNTNPFFECPLKIRGLALTVFKLDGVTPDPGFQVTGIAGGTVTSTPSCSSNGSSLLFDIACNQGAPLANGAIWTFQNVANTCFTPPYQVPAQSFFNLSSVVWNVPIAGLPTTRKLDVTVYYECSEACGPAPTLQRTFHLITP